MDNDFIKNRIAELRMTRDVSERQMSRELGRDSSFLSRVTRNKYYPSLPTIIDICEYFDISLSEFFRDDDDFDIAAEQLMHRINEITTKKDREVLCKIFNILDDRDIKALIRILETYKAE